MSVKSIFNVLTIPRNIHMPLLPTRVSHIPTLPVNPIKPLPSQSHLSQVFSQKSVNRPRRQTSPDVYILVYSPVTALARKDYDLIVP